MKATTHLCPSLSSHLASYAGANDLSISTKPPLCPDENTALRNAVSSCGEIPGSGACNGGIRTATRTRVDAQLVRGILGAVRGARSNFRTAGIPSSSSQTRVSWSIPGPHFLRDVFV